MNRTKLAVAVVCSLLLTPLAPPPFAQSATEEQGVRMSLSECLSRALENNLDLVSARKDPKIAELAIEEAKAPFDPFLQAQAGFARSDTDETFERFDSTTVPPTPPTSEKSSYWNKDMTGSLSWTQALNFGANYTVSWQPRMSDSSPQPVFIQSLQLPGLYSTQSRQSPVNVNFTMHLLKGFGKEYNTVNILVAKTNLEVSRETLRLQALTVIKQTEDAYWDLLASRKAVEAAKESLRLAQDLYELNKKKVEVGTLAPIEITQAEAGVASREEGVIVAEATVKAAEDGLRRFMAIPKGDPLWSQTILPTDVPDYEARTFDLNVVTSKALETRPEIITARQQLDNQSLLERTAKKGVRHTLDLSANVGRTASEFDSLTSPAVRGQSRVDTTIPWSIGLTYGYPVFNRAAKAGYATATVNREKSEINVQNVEQSIRVDTRNAVRNVETGVKRVQAARANTVLQQKTLEAEQKKFENGMSTSFEVLRIQNDLTSARLSQIQAVLAYIKSLSDIERAQGTLLEARGLELDESAGK